MPWMVSLRFLSVAPLLLQLRVPGAFPLTLGEGGCFLRCDFHVVTFQSCTPAPACGDASCVVCLWGWTQQPLEHCLHVGTPLPSA